MNSRAASATSVGDVIGVGAEDLTVRAHPRRLEAFDGGADQLLGFASDLDVPVPMVMVKLKIPDMHDPNLGRRVRVTDQDDRGIDGRVSLLTTVGGEDDPLETV